MKIGIAKLFICDEKDWPALSCGICEHTKTSPIEAAKVNVVGPNVPYFKTPLAPRKLAYCRDREGGHKQEFHQKRKL